MSFSDDSELRELFRQEVDERVARLIEGSQALAGGPVSDEVSGAMFREGHTIKGTGRVMGFVAISRAGQALESVWQQLQHGDLEADPALARALERLSRALPTALDADPEEGNAELTEALAELNDVLSGEATPQEDEPTPEAAPQTFEQNDDVLELGGLLGALDDWASEEMLRVNAAQMYRLINTVASLDLHSQALRSMVVDIADAVESGSGEGAVERIASGVSALEHSVRRAREYALHLASAQLRDVTDTFPQLVKYLAKKTGKEVRFELVGDDCAVDRQIIERLGDPLRQLIVNAIEHGIEDPAARSAAGKPTTATLSVRAAIKDHRMMIEVEDDGRGIDWEVVDRIARRRNLLHEDDFDEGAVRALLFAPGFSTAQAASELVGDGNGLAMVAEKIEELHGSLELETELATGTKFTLTVPTSRALQDALIVRCGDHQFGLPEAAIADVIDLAVAEISGDDDHRQVMWMDQPVPLRDFSVAVGLRGTFSPTKAIVLRNPRGATAFAVAEVVGQRQVAAKELGPLLGGSPHLTGAALLGGGDVVVLVDPSRLQDRAGDLEDSTGAFRVLVVDDSQGARQVLAGALASSGFEATVAGSAAEALAALEEVQVDALVVDFAMPGPDGVELVTAVRAKHGDLPVVMLSGVANDEDQQRARLAGVDEYFDKADFREGALAETLRTLISRKVAP